MESDYEYDCHSDLSVGAYTLIQLLVWWCLHFNSSFSVRIGL
jgi:hypothetical protein